MRISIERTEEVGESKFVDMRIEHDGIHGSVTIFPKNVKGKKGRIRIKNTKLSWKEINRLLINKAK